MIAPKTINIVSHRCFWAYVHNCSTNKASTYQASEPSVPTRAVPRPANSSSTPIFYKRCPFTLVWQCVRHLRRGGTHSIYKLSRVFFVRKVSVNFLILCCNFLYVFILNKISIINNFLPRLWCTVFLYDCLINLVYRG